MFLIPTNLLPSQFWRCRNTWVLEMGKRQQSLVESDAISFPPSRTPQRAQPPPPSTHRDNFLTSFFSPLVALETTCHAWSSTDLDALHDWERRTWSSWRQFKRYWGRGEVEERTQWDVRKMKGFWKKHSSSVGSYQRTRMPFRWKYGGCPGTVCTNSCKGITVTTKFKQVVVQHRAVHFLLTDEHGGCGCTPRSHSGTQAPRSLLHHSLNQPGWRERAWSKTCGRFLQTSPGNGMLTSSIYFLTTSLRYILYIIKFAHFIECIIQ